MDSKIKIIGINASPFIKGNCSKLINKVLREAEICGANVELLNLSQQNIPFFDNWNKKPSKVFTSIQKKIEAADAIIFATPVHWHNVSARMKNFIDHLTYLELGGWKLEGKVAGFIAVGDTDGAWKAILDMVGPLNHMGMMVPPYAMLFQNTNLKKSEKNWVKKDVSLLAKNVMRMVFLTKQKTWGYQKDI